MCCCCGRKNQGLGYCAAVWCIVQGVIYTALAICGLMVYSCDLPMGEDGRWITLYWRILYLFNPECASFNIVVIEEVDVQLITEVSAIVTRTHNWMYVYAVASSLWVATSLVMFFASLCVRRGKLAFILFCPWIIVTGLTLFMDLAAMITYAIDASNINSAEDVYHLLDIDTQNVTVDAFDESVIFLKMPSIFMAVLSARFGVVWIINFIILGCVIKAALHLARDSNIVSQHSSRPTTIPRSVNGDRRKETRFENQQNEAMDRLSSLDDNPGNRYQNSQNNTEWNNDYDNPNFLNPANSPRRSVSPQGLQRTDSPPSRNGEDRGGDRFKAQQEQQQYNTSRYNQQQEQQPYQNPPQQVENQHRLSSSRSIDSVHSVPSLHSVQSNQSQPSIQSEHSSRVDYNQLISGLQRNNSDAIRSTIDPASGNGGKDKRMLGKPPAELRSQLPWSYFQSRDDPIQTPKKDIQQLAEKEDLPPVPVPDYTLHFPKKKRGEGLAAVTKGERSLSQGSTESWQGSEVLY